MLSVDAYIEFVVNVVIKSSLFVVSWLELQCTSIPCVHFTFFFNMDNCNNVPKVPFDPGWNDPPTFSYTAQQTTPNRPRNFLNKRVAFPLSGGSSASGPVPPVNLPHVPSISPGPVSMKNPPKTEDNPSMDTDITPREVKNILLEYLDGSTELGAKANDIKRRINVMEEMWINGKLSKQIHFQMNLLAHALQNDQGSKADEIHRALMVDHVSAVGSWMPAIKQLIHHCIARSELLSIDEQ